MAKSKSPRTFWIVLKDDDNTTCNIKGLSSDDTDWTNRVYEAQQRGRHVRLETPDGTYSEQQIINLMAQAGFKYTEDPIAL